MVGDSAEAEADDDDAGCEGEVGFEEVANFKGSDAVLVYGGGGLAAGSTANFGAGGILVRMNDVPEETVVVCDLSKLSALLKSEDSADCWAAGTCGTIPSWDGYREDDAVIGARIKSVISEGSWSEGGGSAFRFPSPFIPTGCVCS